MLENGSKGRNRKIRKDKNLRVHFVEKYKLWVFVFWINDAFERVYINPGLVPWGLCDPSPL